jgi:outer membrane lipoprotein LolB
MSTTQLRLFLFGAWLGLSACATVPPAATWSAKEQLAKRQALTHWQIDGSIATITPTSTLTGQFSYRQCAQRYQLQLFGPFHSGLMTLRYQSPGFWLTQNGKSHFFKSEAELLQVLQLLPLPITALSQWLKGVPQTGEAKQEQDGQITQISNPPWQINYLAYQLVNIGDTRLPLPQRISVQNFAHALRGKIAIRNWQISEQNSCN